MKINNKERILEILIKNPLQTQTITSLSKETGISRAGIWKILKKLESEELIILKSVGSGKTSTYIIELNWKNPLTEKTIELILIQEALKHKRWRFNFEKLEKQVDFLILYGSILHSPKQANDIDILGIVSNKNKFIEIDKDILDIQKTQLKKIHSINLTPLELKNEIQSQNKAYVEAIKKGIILFGQDKFVRFIKDLRT